MEKDFQKIEDLVDDLKEYINTRVAQFKLIVAEKLSGMLSFVISVLMITLVFFLVLVLVCIAAAIAVGEWLQHMWLGYLLVAGGCLLLGLLLWFTRERWLRKSLLNAFIKMFFENDRDGKD